MKANKDSERVTNPIVVVPNPSITRPVPKLFLYLMLFICVTYIAYTLRIISSTVTAPCRDGDGVSDLISTRRLSRGERNNLQTQSSEANRTETIVRRESVAVAVAEPTEIKHVVFGIAASAQLWSHRKEYIKLWFRPEAMRGVVWLDTAVPDGGSPDSLLPPVRISGDTSAFRYKNKRGHRSAIRISRIVAETLRQGFGDARWFVMGDDDTVFVPDNLVRILRRYDHNQMYYIGSTSESHLQNIFFSYAMAYGGGGFAISRPLAAALAEMQDRCIRRYPALYGSDERVHACMAELGIPLTKEIGFHQYDVYGNLFGLLAAHPVTPFVSLHHLDVVEPIFPNVTRVKALQRLADPIKLDSAAIMQQSICYHRAKHWTISVSWGYSVQLIRGVISPREMEMPIRTFLNWYRNADYKGYSFNTRAVGRNPCQKPFVFYFSESELDRSTNRTITKYLRHDESHALCTWRMDDPSEFDQVIVFKRPDPDLWNRSPRRNCCRIMDSEKNGTMLINVGVCLDGEVTEL